MTKRYLTDHDALIKYGLACISYGRTDPFSYNLEKFHKVQQAQQDCLEIEIPEWATHVTDSYQEGCQCEEIPTK